jgi:hypothetical protein
MLERVQHATHYDNSKYSSRYVRSHDSHLNKTTLLQKDINVMILIPILSDNVDMLPST